MPAESLTRLQNLFLLQRQMSRDSDLVYAELHQRDRKIAVAGGDSEKPGTDQQLLHWLSRLLTVEDIKRANEIESGHRLITIGISLLGLLLGWLTIMGLFQYDGQGRVNLVYLLIVLVGLQLCLSLLTLVAMLPQSMTGWIPGFSRFQQLLRWFSPGRLQKLFARFMPASERQGISELLGRQHKVFADIGKWQIFSWSQLFGVSFNLAALLSIFILIATRDIAFGWSSTLAIDPLAILGLTDMLSWPWRAWLPAAVPDLQLVEASHYFRLQNGTAAVEAEILGHWWPFVMLCLGFYGLLPRLLLLLFSRFQLSSAYTRTLHYFPGRREVLTRLNTAVIETRAKQHDDDSEDVAGEPAMSEYQMLGESLNLVDWTGLVLDKSTLLDEIQLAGKFTLGRAFPAGVKHTLAEDERAIRQLGRLDTNVPIGILVKSWEPPLGELTDFIGDLRQAVATQQIIYLLPVAIKAGQLLPPAQADLDEWQRFVQRLVDPWVTLIPIVPRDQR